MDGSRDEIDSTTGRRLTLRKRPDLVIRCRPSGSARSWLVKDPVARRYYELCDEEHTILEMLDGQASLIAIKRRFEELFAPLLITFDEIQAFLHRLHECGLIVADAPGQGAELFRQSRKRRRRAWLEVAVSILALRIGSIDPARFLNWLAPRVAWAFSPVFLAACVTFCVAAAVLASIEFDTLCARLPEFSTLFAARNLLGLAASLAIVKGLHELGHAVTCKHFGGECREIGVMLLVFTPCLYCDVSDAWLFPSKWARIAVSAAGVLVEVVLAAGCMFLWWFTEPGELNALLLNMAIVCSLSTIVFNGNPLLRYDGYYVLSDLLDTPNLGPQSQALVGNWLARKVLGIELVARRSLPTGRRPLLVLYAFASTAYRWFVVLAILWFCHRVLKPYGLEILALVVAAAAICGLVIFPLANLFRIVLAPANRYRMHRRRAAAVLAIAVALLAGVLQIPLPYRVTASAVVQPRDARPVYVTVPGGLVWSLPAGSPVDEGEELARLENLDLDRELAELAGRRRLQRLELDNLRTRLPSDPSLAPLIPVAEETLADLEGRLRQRTEDQERLTLRAMVRGTVIPPPHRLEDIYRPGVLSDWQGTPQDDRALGAYLPVGTFVCLVGDPGRLEAQLVIEQGDVPFVRRGQLVRLQLDETPGRALCGTIIEVAKTELEIAPRELSRGSELVVRYDRDGLPRPAAPSYQARVAIDESSPPLLVGTRGRAKVLVDPQTAGSRLLRYFRRLLRFSF